MHVTNSTGVELFVAPLGQYVAAGETVEVDAEVGDRLVDQGWTSAVQKAAQKRARAQKRAAKEEEPEPETPAEPDPTPGDEPESQED